VWVSAVKDSAQFVAIGGFRAKVTDPRALVRALNVACAPYMVQIVDASKVAGRDHLWMAAVNAVKATETGLALSKSIGVEALLYASAQDQITKALSTLGVSAKSTTIALMVFAPSHVEAETAYGKTAELLDEEDDSVLEIDSAKALYLKKAYGIGEAEIEAAGGEESLGGLVVERGALLGLRR
jgi:KEOPS complex subunit Cgi121